MTPSRAASSRSSRHGQPAPWSAQDGGPASLAASLLENPILERELRSRWRRPLTYIVLFFYTAALALVAWQLAGTALEQSKQLDSGFGSGAATVLPGVALFEGSVRAQAMIALWASAMLCAPIIARERELKMLPELILANLSASQIVRGKWLATLCFAAVLLVIPLPLQALAFMLGGVSPGEWLGAFVLQVGAMILGSAVGLWCSSMSDRVARSMSTACVGSVLLSIPLIAGLAHMSSGPLVTIGMGLACLLLSLPLMLGAQNCVKYLPLDSLRPAVADLPASPAAMPVAPASYGARPEPAQKSVQEQPSEQPSPSVRALENAQHELAGAQGVAVERRESWVFPLLRAAGWHNPLVWREMRVRLRQPFFDVSALLSISLCLLAMPALGSALFSTSTGGVMSLVFAVWAVCGVACALGAAQGFTREREQRMLEGLMLSTMSPRSIVAGKVAAPILIALHAAALPLGLFAAWTMLWSLMHGANIAALALLGCAGFSLLGASCGTWLSFWCRTSSVSAMGSLAMFCGLLATPVSLSNIGTRVFQDANAAFWEKALGPLFQADGSAAFWAAGLFLCTLLGAASLALLAHLSIVLQPKALEREGRSIMHADLTRNLH